MKKFKEEQKKGKEYNTLNDNATSLFDIYQTNQTVVVFKQTLIYGVHLVWRLHHLQMNYVLWILLAFFQISIHEFYK